MDDRFDATCTLGLEQVLAGELAALGARQVAPRRGGVRFAGDPSLAARACLWLRSATRVRQQLAAFGVATADDLYAGAAAVPWERMIGSDDTIAVDASVRDAVLRHSGYAGLKVKDAIVDRVREREGRRPDVDRERPALAVKLVLQRDRARLYRDLSGESLHKRGYRPAQVRGPLNEATAAGLLLLAGWDGTRALLDPMCGSGTFVIEAAWIALDRAPGLTRPFAAERWRDHDAALWARARAEAEQRARASLDVPIGGADAHAGALAIARAAAGRAGVASLVRLVESDVERLEPPVAPGFVITNPPYGERLGEGAALERTWRALGTFLKRRCDGARAHVLSGDPALSRHLRLRASRRWPVRNAGIDCRLLRYEIRAPRAGE